MNIHIIAVGKTKEAWLQEAVCLYEDRLKGTLNLKSTWVKTDEQLIEAAAKERRCLALDPEGKAYKSEEFSKLLMTELVAGGSHVAFLIGGTEGLPTEIRKQYPLVSLSPLTFTHQITRLILIEQIYRAVQIAQGTRYHKA